MQNKPQRHRDTEKGILHKELTNRIIASAIEVHRTLGPGLLESAYEECFCHELYTQGISFERQKPLPLKYKEINLDCGYRMDIVVDNMVIVELKCVDKITVVHEAQVLTYLRLSHIKVGLIINFYTDVLKNGIKRLVL
ncbi:MAG: GxxExxY protein [Nitrospiraceae bacterium]|nr:MAG: GxxExxY protein [Nitrospiraceae bacterium]